MGFIKTGCLLRLSILFKTIFTEAKDTFELVHDPGTCEKGWDKGINIIASSAEECFNECVTRPKVGYFAYAVSRPAGQTPDNCACYLEEDKCPEGSDQSFKAYQIEFEGNQHHSWILLCT